EWLARLRSGKYQQAKGSLCKVDDNGDEAFCCIGVLADVIDKDGWSGPRPSLWLMTPKMFHGTSMFMAGSEFHEAIGYLVSQEELSEWNDAQGLSFSEIADRIEQSLNQREAA